MIVVKGKLKQWKENVGPVFVLLRLKYFPVYFNDRCKKKIRYYWRLRVQPLSVYNSVKKNLYEYKKFFDTKNLFESEMFNFC